MTWCLQISAQDWTCACIITEVDRCKCTHTHTHTHTHSHTHTHTQGHCESIIAPIFTDLDLCTLCLQPTSGFPTLQVSVPSTEQYKHSKVCCAVSAEMQVSKTGNLLAKTKVCTTLCWADHFYPRETRYTTIICFTCCEPGQIVCCVWIVVAIYNRVSLAGNTHNK